MRDRQRIELQAAYVLHARAFGDSSLIVEVFSANHGKLGLVAKGARAPKSKKRALLQMLQPLLLSWRDSGELGSLMAIESAGMPTTLTGETLFCAWYANELLMKLLQRHDPHPHLFAAYAQLLARVERDAEGALRAFEQVLLDELGYGLAFPDDVAAGSHYHYDAQLGFRAALPSDAASDCYQGTGLIALRDDDLKLSDDYQTARRLSRAALRPLLAGRVLDSARLLRELREMTPQPVK